MLGDSLRSHPENVIPFDSDLGETRVLTGKYALLYVSSGTWLALNIDIIFKYFVIQTKAFLEKKVEHDMAATGKCRLDIMKGDFYKTLLSITLSKDSPYGDLFYDGYYHKIYNYDIKIIMIKAMK